MDDAVLPSFLSVTTSGSEPSGYARGVDDPYLRVGRISKVYKPTDDANQSKKFIEYDVEADIWEASGSYTKITFPRARMVSLFGAVGDFSHHTPRVVTSNPNTINQGSLVLVLCVNGDTRQAIIIGGVQHPSLPKENPEQDGHNSQDEFNGINTSINKDGELIIKFRGATNADGTLTDSADKDASGSNLSFTKDGSFKVQTGDAKECLQLNRPDGKALLQADTEVRVKTQHTVIEADTTKLGGDDAKDSLVMGTTYRNHETSMHQTILQQLEQIAQLLTVVGGMLSSAGASMVTPVTGAVAAAPQIAAAGAQITASSGMFTAFAAAIQQFESLSTSYLSTKNFTDT